MSGKPPSYVTGVVCAECHPAESDRWEGSHHDLAMQVASDETVLGDFAGTQFEYFGRSTSFYKKRGDFFVRTTGSSGSVGEFRVAYTFGASPLQQYLLELPGGRFQALGVAWDARLESQGGQRWFHLYPDEDVNADHPVHWTARNQNWNANCAECHSTGLEKNYDGEADRYSTAWSDVDVSCEACHGQGSRHVAWARAEEPEADGLRGLTVSPGNAGGPRWTLRKGERTATRSGPRGAESELNSCAPCHSRRRRLVDRPAVGAPFLNGYHPSLLEEDLYYTDGQIQGEVYVYGSFLQSRMYAPGESRAATATIRTARRFVTRRTRSAGSVTSLWFTIRGGTISTRRIHEVRAAWSVTCRHAPIWGWMLGGITASEFHAPT